MRIIWNYIQVFLAAVGGSIGWFLGAENGLLYALLAFVIVDYLTGLMCGVLDKNLSSDVGARGIFKKVFIFMMVGIAHMLDTQIIGYGSVLRTAAIFFYISNEGISILENASKIGLPIPQKLKDVLAQLRSEKTIKDESNQDTNIRNKQK